MIWLHNLKTFDTFLQQNSAAPPSATLPSPPPYNPFLSVTTLTIFSSSASPAKMAPAPETNTQPTTLKADYTAPTSTKTFSHTLPSPSVTSTKEKTEYLSALRKSVLKLQDDVNGFLTTKMEEDKALAAKAGQKVDDRVEEEQYGEEVVED